MEKETYIKYLKDYLHLISLYLNKKEEPSFKIDESNFNIFLNLSKKHSLTALFYKVVKDTKVDIKEEYLKVLEQYYFSNVQKHVLFDKERKELFEYCNKNNIIHLPLKGILLKHYYPDPYTREFADNDIWLAKDKEISIRVAVGDDTVWLSANQMALLFDRDEKTIRKHINSIFREEELNKENNTQKMRVDGVKQRVPFYTLDVIISVGYRVKSQRGIEFRQWANSVLKQYIINGYAINEKRLIALQKTVEIQSRMLADTLSVEQQDVLRTVSQYTEALLLLDQYDHHDLEKPEGTKPLYKLTYKDCRDIISRLETEYKSDVFGVEKEAGKVEGILGAVYQDVFGGEVYPSLEEKAANLLYFIIKDHPFNDGCKRIAASLFLEFLNRNGCLFKNGEKTISDGTLVAITLMIAESDPSDKEIMITLVMNLMNIR